MPNLSGLVALLFCPALLTLVQIVTAIYDLYSMGKSKSRRKKTGRLIPTWKKLLLLGYVEACKYHCLRAKRFLYVYWIYLAVEFVGIFLLLISTLFPQLLSFLDYYVVAKVCALDIPINIYGVIMTKIDKKHGGCTWRWNEKD